MPWHYGLILTRAENLDEDYYGLHEMYINVDGETPHSWTTTPVAIGASSLEEFEEVLSMIRRDCIHRKHIYREVDDKLVRVKRDA